MTARESEDKLVQRENARKLLQMMRENETLVDAFQNSRSQPTPCYSASLFGLIRYFCPVAALP
jgi:hypothetical protein